MIMIMVMMIIDTIDIILVYPARMILDSLQKQSIQTATTILNCSCAVVLMCMCVCVYIYIEQLEKTRSTACFNYSRGQPESTRSI